MNKLIKILVESKFNFNIDIENNKEMPRLSKLKYKSINLKNAYNIAIIIDAFKLHNLTILDYEQRKHLYDNFEDFKQYQYKAKDKEELKDIIKNADNDDDLNWIDVSSIDDMKTLFYDSNSKFNGDISKWDVSNVIFMDGLFYNSEFNGDISDWNVKSVKSMSIMFGRSKFNRDISKWNVRKVKTMDFMFKASKFNTDISNWNVKNVLKMNYMFAYSDFNQDISNWKINEKCITSKMFEGSIIKKEYMPDIHE